MPPHLVWRKWPGVLQQPAGQSRLNNRRATCSSLPPHPRDCIHKRTLAVHARQAQVPSCFEPGAPNELDCEWCSLVQRPDGKVFGKTLGREQVLKGVACAHLQCWHGAPPQVHCTGRVSTSKREKQRMAQPSSRRVEMQASYANACENECHSIDCDSRQTRQQPSLMPHWQACSAPVTR